MTKIEKALALSALFLLVLVTIYLAYVGQLGSSRRGPSAMILLIAAGVAICLIRIFRPNNKFLSPEFFK